jgi:hypothetical protein
MPQDFPAIDSAQEKVLFAAVRPPSYQQGVEAERPTGKEEVTNGGNKRRHKWHS